MKNQDKSRKLISYKKKETCLNLLKTFRRLIVLKCQNILHYKLENEQISDGNRTI